MHERRGSSRKEFRKQVKSNRNSFIEQLDTNSIGHQTEKKQIHLGNAEQFSYELEQHIKRVDTLNLKGKISNNKYTIIVH